ncbi:hypothetical protein L3Q65_00855 (plasmid) [Amycolatopsis sp. FU40]|uniref:hypothetical protein n=1 Tax=Amycolatopsis sp. FU40 TaxID=2914159 RepID=UPI001F393884|nr:hypothetical protein [Amycolatopsis sp. FU40]UKD50875.1 hypothetical protein L3Q65_00855 [Amycolatopsis sp. FU40]
MSMNASEFAAVVAGLGKKRGEPISMIDIRSALDQKNLSRAEQDKAIKQLSKDGVLVVYPETRNAFRTKEADNAAITVGGTKNHLLTLQLL